MISKIGTAAFLLLLLAVAVVQQQGGGDNPLPESRAEMTTYITEEFVTEITEKEVVTTEQTTEVSTIISTNVEKPTFTLTYYCSCEKCCGKWATTRPQGEPVRGCGGEVLIPGYSVSADLSLYPLGTKFYGKDGQLLYEVMDKGGAVKGDHLDVYMATHEEALRGGRDRGVELGVGK